ncbi:phage baseplate assembly protein [Pseudomonas sp. GV071]|uniref:phage baseplate assembly protein n=1 Tax=Pseudomonas sp. GV071 TaxID=2135754 RepID=UPI000D33B219|nr:phage tail protein [Pseudomonas sp. GV071]PTQ68137.1 prophage tail gpP-like protein [Pseudomonas sp. GV071]
MPSESISLAIGGEAHAHWDSWSVESDLRTPADGFELALHTQDTARLSQVLVEGAPCTLSLGADRVLSGQIDELIHEVSRSGVTIKVTGRDRAAALVDSSVPSVYLRNASLAEIVQQLVKPFGITQIEIRAAAEKPNRLIQFERTQNAWQALTKVVEAYAAWPWMEPDGRLVIGGPDYNAAPVHTLVMRLDGKGNNVSSLSVRRSFPSRYSKITVLAQHGQYDTDDLNPERGQLSATVQDTTVPGNRACVVQIAAEKPEEVSAAALELMSVSKLESLEIQAVVQGHRNAAGSVWAPGQRVIVRSEPHGLDGTFFLMSRKLSLARTGGATTLLRLRADKTWKANTTSTESSLEVKAAK